jgi:hypothetical protein
VLSFNMKDLLVSQVDRLILKKSAISNLEKGHNSNKFVNRDLFVDVCPKRQTFCKPIRMIEL